MYLNQWNKSENQEEDVQRAQIETILFSISLLIEHFWSTLQIGLKSEYISQLSADVSSLPIMINVREASTPQTTFQLLLTTSQIIIAFNSYLLFSIAQLIKLNKNEQKSETQPNQDISEQKHFYLKNF